MTTSVQTTVVVKRLRTGHTLALQLISSGAELYQVVDPTSGSVTPSWSTSGDHPVITPQGRSLTADKTGTLSDWTWKYLGNTVATSSTDVASAYASLFKVDKTTGKLEIIGNLASKTNTDNDTLTFSAKVTVDGVSAVMEKNVEVVIAAGGASSYYGNVRAVNGTILSADVPQTALETSLKLGGSDVSGYTVKWYKNVRDTAHLLSSFNPAKVTRADVDGTTLFIADFVVGGTVVYTDGIVLLDTADEYNLSSATTGDIADSGNVTVTATLYKAGTNEKPSGITKCNWSVWMYKIKGELDKSGEINFTDGTLEATDITARYTDKTDPLVCKVYVNAADAGDSDVVVMFEAEFEI